MPFVHDEMQASGQRGLGGYLRAHSVEWGVMGIVLVTRLTAAPGLAEAPLRAVGGALYDVVPLVLFLLLAEAAAKRFGVARRTHPAVHHLTVVLAGGLVTELAEWALAAGLGLYAPAAPGPPGADAQPWLGELLAGLAYAGLFWGMCLLVRALLHRAANGPDEATPPVAGLLALLPHSIREDVQWMKAEGNYVDVHGPRDHQLVNYVFSRAIEELGASGMQVHRSYWVALGAIDQLDTANGKPRLVLRSGERIPVSRTFLREVRSLVPTTR